jgi:hypothetical protein
MMNRMNEYDKMRTMQLLQQHEWDWFITIHQNEPDISHQWLLITEAVERMKERDNELMYWFCFAQGGISQKPHAHGVIRTSLSRTLVMKSFRECNEPSVKPIEDDTRLFGYLIKQALQITITNIGEEQ